MAASFPDPGGVGDAGWRGGLAGFALGAVALAGGSLIVYDTGGLLTATAGLVTTLVVSLLVGVWAGAPAREHEEPPVRERWLGTALAVAVAGLFATLWMVYPPLETSPAGRVLGLLLLIALPVYALGMLLPVLLAAAERRDEEAGEGPRAMGAVLVGAVAGLGVGVLVSAVALIPWLSPGALLLAVSVALLAPVFFAEVQAPAPEERLLHRAPSPFGVVRVTEVVFPGERQPERRLYLDDEQESGEMVRSGAPTLAYVAAAEAWLARGPAGGRYLFLGGGGFTLPRRVAERDSRAHITVVELNPEVVRAAYRFFGVRAEHPITAVQADARAFLERGPAGEWDRIYVDVYGGDESLPLSLVTREAMHALRARLRPGGVVGFNAIGVADGPEAPRIWSLVHTVAESFAATAVYTHLGADFPERQNFLVLAAPDAEAALPERVGTFERWPDPEWPAPPGTALLREVGE